MQQVLQVMEQQMNSMTPSQRRAADYILKNPVESSFLTLERLSLAAGISTTTIIRLALSLGYSGYAHFQKDLQELLRDGVAPYTRLDFNTQCQRGNNLILNCAEMQINNIQSTINFLSQESLNHCLNMFHDASRIYVIGMRTSHPVAYYLYHGLNRILGNCDILTLNNGDCFEKILAMKPSDLVVAISFPRYLRYTVDLAKTVKDQGAKIIAITDGYNSPLAPYSDLLLPCSVHSFAFHNSIVSPIFLVDYLITALALKESAQTKSRLEAAESLFKKIHAHIEK